MTCLLAPLKTLSLGVVMISLISQAHAWERIDSEWRMIPVPILNYSPEAKLGLGGSLVFARRQHEQVTRPDIIPLSLMVTTSGQYGVSCNPDLLSADQKWEWRAGLSLSHNPAYFYGLGSSTSSAAREKFDLNVLSVRPTLYRRFDSGVGVGWGVALRSTAIPKREGPLLSSGTLPGSQGGVLLGMGPVIEWDTRDHPFYPTSGHLWRYQVIAQSAHFAGDFTGQQHVLDLREFMDLHEGWIFGVQGLYSASSATLPFDSFVPLGLRGISRERFRDRGVAMVQGELRFPLAVRWAGAAFVGVGDVMGSPETLALKSLKPAGGAGLRYIIDPREKITIRADLGFSQYGWAPYIFMQESF